MGKYDFIRVLGLAGYRLSFKNPHSYNLALCDYHFSYLGGIW